ncbi:ornithine cyclodeaminase [Stella humosa]|uniref:Ornithine cyclodeaminase n=1 Tax=Stella humosa TaxID=94 RepID=A0A3N1LGX3_9PROT|nr:ornithine cyclodeaminase family protein [Stella humosa]ROP90672.1 ornithine cyclodeaminase [Stella humosa]BBK29429.1 ornithine cyclodeaminase [Stella humosa]
MSSDASAPASAAPRIVDAATVQRTLDFPSLVHALDEAFRAGREVPLRHHHPIAQPAGRDAMLLLMPAWSRGGAVGIKIVTVYPDNGRRGLPAVIGTYLLLDGATGAPKAVIDGSMLTVRRTAAASALAASRLARADAGRLVIVGTGALAPHLVRAHAAVRPIRQVAVWGRRREAAETLARTLSEEGFAAEAVGDLGRAVRDADIVSCATLANEPLVRGEWLAPGCHLDLVGGFTPTMREADDEAVRRARIFVDTREGALHEAGDLVQPIAAGVIGAGDVVGDLFDLARGTVPGREHDDEITYFKSVGTALEDLAAAELVVQRL